MLIIEIAVGIVLAVLLLPYLLILAAVGIGLLVYNAATTPPQPGATRSIQDASGQTQEQMLMTDGVARLRAMLTDKTVRPPMRATLPIVRGTNSSWF